MRNADQHTSFMVELFDEREILASPQAFQSFFGKPGTADRTVFEEDAGSVKIDIIRSNGQTLAETVHRGQSSKTNNGNKNLTDQNYTNVDREYPLIEKEMNINSKQLTLRQAGENTDGSRKRLQRNRILARDLHMESIRESVRTMEFFSRESILTGFQPAILDTVNSDLIYDFKRNPDNIFAAAVAWNNAAAKIMDDIDDMISVSITNAFIKPDFMGIGDDAMASLINNASIQSLADNRRFELVRISADLSVPSKYDRFIKGGWEVFGRITTPKGRKLWIFTNDQEFINTSGQTERYMPSDKAFVINTDARMDRYFGPADSLPPTPDQAIWQMSVLGFNMESAPMPLALRSRGRGSVPRARAGPRPSRSRRRGRRRSW